jgi:hypothetical protein
MLPTYGSQLSVTVEILGSKHQRYTLNWNAAAPHCCMQMSACLLSDSHGAWQLELKYDDTVPTVHLNIYPLFVRSDALTAFPDSYEQQESSARLNQTGLVCSWALVWASIHLASIGHCHDSFTLNARRCELQIW